MSFRDETNAWYAKRMARREFLRQRYQEEHDAAPKPPGVDPDEWQQPPPTIEQLQAAVKLRWLEEVIRMDDCDCDSHGHHNDRELYEAMVAPYRDHPEYDPAWEQLTL